MAESSSNKDKVFCPVYEVWNSRYACAKRYSNANREAFHPLKGFGPGSNDLACRECEIGRRLYKAGFAKKIVEVSPKKKEGIVSEEKPTLKRCIKCNEEKPLDAFYRHQTTKDGRDPRCKDCQRLEGQRRTAEKRAAAKPQPAAATEKPVKADGLTLALDFSGYAEAFEKLASDGVRDFRTPEGQAMYILTQYLGLK
jgi:hypothetical protein